MSLQATANLIQQQGRGDDKMLVHMTPREVAGLEAIAKAKGGALTINPKTGLPEAGFLDDVLPIAASAALMYFGGPLGASIGTNLGLSGALAQGVGMGLLAGGATTLLTGDVNKGLKTGLTAGVLSGGMSALSGPSTTEIPTANVETATPALQAASTTPTTSPNAFAYNAAGEMVPANYAPEITGATNMPVEMAGPPKSAMTPQGFTGKEKLAMGLGGAGLLSVLGSQQQGGVADSSSKGTIRPYEYSTAMRQPAPGQSQYFQPIQYDIAGRTAQPIDTSERTYFTQGYKALPTYAAANGGEVPPQLNNMPAGGLAAIEGMRDGYGALQTTDGNIPQFSNGGMPTNKMLDQMQQMKFERDMPDELRDFTRARRMGLLEGTMLGDEQAKSMGYKPQDFMFAPQVSPDGKYMNALATMNKELTDDTEMKLMALGYKTPEKSGIARYGAGLSHKLDKDSDISGYFEQSPGGRDKSYGAKYTRRFNQGGGLPEGDLGGYSDGGRMLKGPGDGVSDSIPATINDKQPARLADGEFVIPARIVSELGNGSTDAGAKRLYAMMDRIQEGRKKSIGKGKVAVDTKAKKHLPA
jgi:hypothetical protein